MILALGTYGTEGLSPGEREPLTGKLLDLYRNDPDSGIHGAAEWTLRQWRQQEKLKELDAELMKLKDWGDRRWFVNSQGQTFAVIEGPVEFRMGSPPTETERFAGNESPQANGNSSPFRHRRQGGDGRAISAVREAGRHHKRPLPAFRQRPQQVQPRSPRTVDRSRLVHGGPLLQLAERAGGFTEGPMVLPPQRGRGLRRGDVDPCRRSERTGYRLPTEAEWEYACRAGAVTSRYYGHSLDLLDAYAWYQANSKEHAWTCGSLFPNDLGLFDMLGNMYEWCQDSRNASKPAKKGIYNDLINISESIVEKTLVSCGAGRSTIDRRSSARRTVAGTPRRTVTSDDGFRPSRTYH